MSFARRRGTAYRLWAAFEYPFVIPSEVEESLAIQKIIRDVSTSLDMTEMLHPKALAGHLNPLLI
jgi:hypothetical protein